MRPLSLYLIFCVWSFQPWTLRNSVCFPLLSLWSRLCRREWCFQLRPAPPPRLGTLALLWKNDLPTRCCFGGGGEVGGVSQALQMNSNHLPTRAGFMTMTLRAPPQKDLLGAMLDHRVCCLSPSRHFSFFILKWTKQIGSQSCCLFLYPLLEHTRASPRKP